MVVDEIREDQHRRQCDGSHQYQYLSISCFFRCSLKDLIVFIGLISSGIEYRISRPLWRRLFITLPIRLCGTSVSGVMGLCIVSICNDLCVWDGQGSLGEIDMYLATGVCICNVVSKYVIS